MIPIPSVEAIKSPKTTQLITAAAVYIPRTWFGTWFTKWMGAMDAGVAATEIGPIGTAGSAPSPVWLGTLAKVLGGIPSLVLES